MTAMKRRDEVLQRNKGMAKKHPDVLIARYIEEIPRRGVQEAQIRRYGVAVWAVIGYLKGVHGDVRQTAEDYEMPLDAVRAAQAYYRKHRYAIDARLAPMLYVDRA